MIVEQFLPSFHYGDAVGNSATRFHHFLLNQGIESRIIALSIDTCLQSQASLFKDYRTTAGSIKVLHFASPSKLSDFFKEETGKKVLIYHNITPPSFFVDFSDKLVQSTDEGRKQLEMLSQSFDLSVVDSEYNAGELKDLGFKNIHVFPIMINLDEYRKEYSKGYYNLLRDDRKNIIFVGRISPNKKIEDLIKTLFFYKKFLSPSIRLIVAGNSKTLPVYYHSVKDLAYRFLLTPDDIMFTDHIPFEELLSVYHSGDVFLSMSEHEGFCLPLIESCFFNVPIVAYAAGSVPEVLGDAGILLKHKNCEMVATLLEKVLFDEALSSSLKERQEVRLKQYIKDSDPEILFSILKLL